MKTKYIIVSFSNATQAYVLTHLAFLSLKARLKEPYEIVIATDREDKYSWIKDYVSFFHLSDELIDEYSGEHNFIWRFKIRLLQDIQKLEDCHIVYVDSDTFCFKDLDIFVKNLDENKPYMHKSEYVLSKYKSKRNKKVYKTLKSKSFGSILIDENVKMINAGIVALPKKSASSILFNVLKACDLLCKEDIPNYYLEQLSFSAFLDQNYDLKYADEYFIHYWGNKDQWQTYLEGLLSKFLMQGFGVEDAVAYIKKEAPKLKAINKDRWLKRVSNVIKKRFV